MINDAHILLISAASILLASLAVLLALYIRSWHNEKKLAEQLSEAIAAGNRRGEFFSSMAHELKTPLSVILGAIQLMEIKSGDPGRNAWAGNLNTIKYNCYRLLRLTNNLLDLARSESGYLVPRLANCELNSFLEEIVQSVRPYAEKKQLQLSCIRASAPINTALDIEKTERIMLNLLSNAIKFSNPGGTITVSIRESEGRVFISVKDTGAGIPVHMQHEIFTRYKQSGQCPRIENEGSGIGLSLVKTFVELQDGNIKLISEVDKGSEFIIDLPVRTAQSSEALKNHIDLHPAAAEAAKVEFSDMYTIST